MSTYEISKSSLLSLKAEILRKQQELFKAKAENDVKIRTIKKSAPLEIKNKGVENRKQNDLTEEEEDLLKKSRTILEAKSKLYDKLSNSSNKQTEEEIEYNKRYLVRFDKKKKSKVSDLPPSDSDEEPDVDKYPESEEERHFSDEYDTPNDQGEQWVEYVDCLGRTRKCLRKDLEHLKANDASLKQSVDAKEIRQTESPCANPVIHAEENLEEKVDKSKEDDQKFNNNEETKESELLSSDMRRELLRQQWEQEEEELRNKDNIHYQDILFSEARTHGVGYYGFSKDEEERAKQQEALKKLREETEQQQKKSQEMKAMRERQLASRIKAAKNRKRARMGLPPEEDEPEPVAPPEDPEKQKLEKEEQTRKLEEEAKEKLLDKARRQHLRPWDIGKEGVKEHYEYSQEEWVDKKRKERPNEFAPPSTYRKEFRSTGKNYEDNLENSNKTLKFTTKKTKGINPYKPKNYQSTSAEYENIAQNPSMEAAPIVNECEETVDERLFVVGDSGFKTKQTNYLESSGNSSDEEIDEHRGRGTEVAPPPTFDYYGPNGGKRPKIAAKVGNIEESIEAGLHFLRKQVEKKESSTKHPREMFLS